MVYVHICVLCYWISAWHPLGGVHILLWAQTIQAGMDGNQLMQPGKVNMDKARSAHATYSCTAVIRVSVWNIKANKSVLMTGFPHLKDRETPYVTSTDRKTWRSLENKAAHWHINSHSHNLQIQANCGHLWKCNAYYTFRNTAQMWQGHKDTKLDILWRQFELYMPMHIMLSWCCNWFSITKVVYTRLLKFFFLVFKSLKYYGIIILCHYSTMIIL